MQRRILFIKKIPLPRKEKLDKGKTNKGEQNADKQYKSLLCCMLKNSFLTGGVVSTTWSDSVFCGSAVIVQLTSLLFTLRKSPA